MAAGDGPSGWWAEPGPDTCEFCLITFYVEVGYYCADCDRPVCPSCVVILFEGRKTLCPECEQGEGDSAAR